MTNETRPAQPPVHFAAPLQVARGVAQVAAIFIITIWGFLDFAFPFPALLTGLGALVVGVLIWALFLSPRPVLRTDRFGQALIELLLIAAAVFALLALGAWWWSAVIFGIAAAAIGFIASSPRK